MKYAPLIIGKLTAKVPVIQGGMGVGISLGGLAGAVANAGGIGIISSAQIGFREKKFNSHPFECNLYQMEKQYQKARKIAPEGIIGFNIMVALKNYKEYVKKAAAIGANLIISGAGLPTDLPEYVKGSETKIAPIVSTEKAANVILKYWEKKYNRTADLVVIEGPEAGGHLGFKKEQLKNFTKDVYDEEIRKIAAVVKRFEEKFCCSIPVVLAGGIDTAKKVQHAMKLGMSGVQVASRFVTTYECDASEAYKMQYIQAKKEDIVIVESPVGMPGRAIRNSFIRRLESGQKEKITLCRQCLRECDPKEIPYCITDALVNAANGNIDHALLFCGAGAYRAEKLETVQEVIDSLME